MLVDIPQYNDFYVCCTVPIKALTAAVQASEEPPQICKADSTETQAVGIEWLEYTVNTVGAHYHCAQSL